MRPKELIGALVALCVLATAAPAATVFFSDDVEGKIRIPSGNFATWEIRNDTGTDPAIPTGTCAPNKPGLSVGDAVLATNTADRPDAFDGAFALWVNDERFVASNAVDVTDGELTAGWLEFSGLRVTVKYRAMQSSPTMRALMSFENPTSVPIVASIVLGTNFGSDANTAQRAPDPNRFGQNWHVTSDSATAPVDPVVLMVSTGPEPFKDSEAFTIAERFGLDDKTFTCATTAGRQLSGDLVVLPGQTVRLLQFARLASTNDEAVEAGAAFDGNPPLDSELMAGITAEESLSIVNWSFFPSTVLKGAGASWLFSGLNGTSNGSPTGGRCGPIPGIGLFDAGLFAPNVDAFDGGLLLFIDDVPLPVTTDISEYVGVRVRVGPATLSGLDVTLTHTALQTSQTLRTLVELSNPTAAALSTRVALATNFGSDSMTVVRSTSDGDAAITSADRWAITSDDDPTSDADPVTTHVVAGPGAPAVLPAIDTDVFQCSGGPTDDGLLATYDLTVAPGETRTLLLFNEVHTVVADAIAAAAAFDETPGARDPLLADLDAAVLTTVANWSLCRRTTYPDAICRIGGLQRDTFAVAPSDSVGEKLLDRLLSASGGLEGAEQLLNSGLKRGAKKTLKRVQASLKVFEKVLKSKKAKAVIAEAARSRLATTSAEIRTTVKGLGAL